MDKIKCCSRCGTPLVPTMIFGGAEWYCTGCGEPYGEFDGFSEREAVPSLVSEKERLAVEFHAIARDFIPGGCQKMGCDLCEKRNEDHRLHMTDEEWKAHGTVLLRLKELRIQE